MCGLFGFVYYGKKGLKDAEKLLEKLAIEASVRGTDATGYSFVNKGNIQIDKTPKPAYEMKYLLPKDVHTVIGHTRHATQGNAKNNYNNHPFKGSQGKTEFAMAHNGVLDNEFEIRENFEIKPNEIQTDSYVACQLMEKMKDFSMDSLRTVGETVEGMFTFTYMDSKENLYIIKNDSPLTILHFPILQLYVYASTDDILFNALTQFDATKDIIMDSVLNEESWQIENISIKPGNILIIRPNGTLERGKFKPKERIWNTSLEYWWGDNYANLDYEDEKIYKELLKSEAVDMGVTEEEFEKLVQTLNLEDIEDSLYSGTIYEVMMNLGI